MPRDEKRRQASLQRQAAKKKQWEKERARSQVAPAGARALIRQAANWPVEECLISRQWREEGELVQIVVARRSPAGQIAAAVFLVDLGCLGVKDAFVTLAESKADYERVLRSGITSRQPMERTDLNLAARVIREAIAYARQLGFKPHRDYYAAAALLAGADPDAADAQVPLGKDGKPFFVAGPYDDARRIVATLTKAVGPQGFNYIVGFPASPSLAIDSVDEAQDEDEEEEDR